MAITTSAGVTEAPLEEISEEPADLGLFSAGGPFESFPGAALIVGRNGVVLGANAAAESISILLQGGGTPELREAVHSALEGKAAQINPLVINREGAPVGGGQAYDLLALPWAESPAALLLGRDITLERSLRAALIESRQRYKDLVEASSDFAWETDTEGRFTFVSEGHLLGYQAAELVGQRALDLVIEPDESEDTPFLSRVPVNHVELWLKRRDGEAAYVSLIGLPLTGPDGSWRGCRGLCRDITAERKHETELAKTRHRERLFAYILKTVREELEPVHMLRAAARELTPALAASGVAIFRLHDDLEFKREAEAGTAMPLQPLDALLERILDGEDQVQQLVETGRYILKATRHSHTCNGALCVWHKETDAAPGEAIGEDEQFLLDEIAAQIGIANCQLSREETLEELSSTDALTGLLNRRTFLENLDRRLHRAVASNQTIALFYIDLDNFKLVNDRHGHQRGDEVLGLCGEILRGQVRSGDLAARLGGDEFGISVEGISEDSAIGKAETLLRAAYRLSQYSGDEEHRLGVSVGIAIFDPARPETLEALMTRADQAMYAAKRRGKGGVALAAPAAKEMLS